MQESNLAESNLAVMELPAYRSHNKVVRALKIARVIHVGETTDTSESPIVDLEFEDGRYPPMRRVSTRDKPFPKSGWYLVVYPGGYLGFSPAAAFEQGNTPLPLTEPGGEQPGGAHSSFSQAEIENWFSYHAPTAETLRDYDAIRTAAKIFAETINRHVPAGPDKSAAMRKLRETTMTANAGIACAVRKEPQTAEEQAMNPGGRD